jgi:osmotically-inducible protein OsmY
MAHRRVDPGEGRQRPGPGRRSEGSFLPARRLSYEEERRQRERPWSPSQQVAADESGTDRAGLGAEHSRAVGGNRGKGPRDYSRSDERIRELICERMLDDDLLDASDIDVRVENGEVILTGTVRERRDKRYAEELAEQCGGVVDVMNSLRVESGH